MGGFSFENNADDPFRDKDPFSGTNGDVDPFASDDPFKGSEFVLFSHVYPLAHVINISFIILIHKES